MLLCLLFYFDALFNFCVLRPIVRVVFLVWICTSAQLMQYGMDQNIKSIFLLQLNFRYHLFWWAKDNMHDLKSPPRHTYIYGWNGYMKKKKKVEYILGLVTFFFPMIWKKWEKQRTEDGDIWNIKYPFEIWIPGVAFLYSLVVKHYKAMKKCTLPQCGENPLKTASRA